MIEKKLSPLIENLFPQHYKENGANFVAFVKAYFEFLEQNFQIIELKSNVGFEVGSIITQGGVTGTVVSFIDDKLLVLVDGFDTFKCVTMCSELIPVVSSTGASSTISAGGVAGRLGTQFWSRRLEELGDVDQTMDLFIVKFKEKYLKNVDFGAKTNKPLLIKNSLDLYRSKGTARSIDLFFRLVYGTGASVYYPSKDLFKLSDAEWYKPKYLEVYTPNTNRMIELVGKQVRGVTTGATAFVERYIKRKIQNGYVHVLYVSNVVGSFAANELLDGGELFSDSPKITGSLSSVTVIDGSTSFSVGSLVDLYSSTGSRAIGRVVEVNSQRGVVGFNLLDGGWGFQQSSNNTYTLSETSDTVMSVHSVVSADNASSPFLLFEDITQHAGEIVYSGDYIFNEGDLISIWDGVSIVNTGYVYDQNQGVSSNGTLTIVLNDSYNLANSFTIALSSNSASNVAIIDSYNSSAVGVVMGNPSTSTLTLSNTSVERVFNVGDQLYQIVSGVEVANGIISDATVSPSGGTINLTDVNGTFRYQTVINRDSGSFGYVSDVSTKVGLYSSNNTFRTGYPIVASYSNTTGVVASTSAGSGASFDISTISKEKSVYVDVGLLSAISDVSLSDWDSSLLQVADFQYMSVGTVFSLGSIDPGSGYTNVPHTLVINPGVAALNRTNFSLSLSNTQGSFVVGETIEQLVPSVRATFNGVDSTFFEVGETVGVGNSLITVATGEVSTATGSLLILSDVEGEWNETHSIFRFANSQQNTSYTSSSSVTVNTAINGTVLSAQDETLEIGRNELYKDFSYSSIRGTTSGATSIVVGVDPIASRPVGYNADVEADVFTANGTIVELQIVDSGFGFSNNQISTLSSDQRIGYVRGYVSGVGVGSGSYRSTTGFLSDVSKIQDGDYYQEYSYDIISRVPLNLYKEMFSKVMHVAGSKFFGNLLIDTHAVAAVGSTTNLTIDQSNTSPFDIFTTDDEMLVERDGDELTLRP